MKNRLLLLVAVCVLAVVGVQPALAITWGEVDNLNSYPHVGAMLVDYPNWGIIPMCTGTLIDPQVFLTAGHCTENLQSVGGPYPLVGVTFDLDAWPASSVLAVHQVITHPDYTAVPGYSNPPVPASNPHDVGVLILVEPVTDIEPASLPREGYLNELKAEGVLRRKNEGAEFTLVGYGSELSWPPPGYSWDGQRRYATSEYQALLKAWLRMSQNQATDDGGTCFGDSGGPAFYWDETDGMEYLVGITSWGDYQCVATGFNYRVDIRDTLGFIEEVLGSLDG